MIKNLSKCEAKFFLNKFLNFSDQICSPPNPPPHCPQSLGRQGEKGVSSGNERHPVYQWIRGKSSGLYFQKNRSIPRHYGRSLSYNHPPDYWLSFPRGTTSQEIKHAKRGKINAKCAIFTIPDPKYSNGFVETSNFREDPEVIVRMVKDCQGRLRQPCVSSERLLWGIALGRSLLETR